MTTTESVIEKPTSKESLFSIGNAFYILETLIIENEGEIDETVDRWLEEYQGKEEEKVDAYCYLIQKFEEISAESKRLADRSTGYSNKVKALKERLKLYLQNRGRDKLETPRFTVTVSSNGGQAPVALNEDITPENLPDQFVKVLREPDMTALRDALLNGNEEALRFARIGERGTHLRIR